MVAFKQDWTVKIMERIRIEKLNRNSDISSIKSILEIFTKIHNDNFENKVENDVPARYAVRVPVIQIAGNRVVPRFISSLFRGDFFIY